ncbi:mucin-5B [Pteropus medius]|uniref:mucin-5B n=1 Tax=Pteropus vampyrus TaxID=132908 RepID=UPI00196B330C|nr:mucin-5B [Pteropus giganteus]
MGTPSGCQTLAWALLGLLSLQKAETQGSTEPSPAGTGAAADGRRAGTAQRVTFIPPVATYSTMSNPNAAHSGRVCSTWGDAHYKTFDGDIFRFPGRCNYVFSAHCGSAYEDFNIQLRRGLAGSRPTITHIVLKTQGLVLEVSNGSVLINGQREELPYSRAGLLVERGSDYTKVNVRLMLTFMWNGEDSALLELDPKYANQTCGLCGDFNGLRAVNEFYAHNARLTPLQFGNLQKLDGPTEQCQDPLPAPADNCTDRDGICHRTLLGAAFAQCSQLVDAGAYLAACAQDLCRCPSCPCATFAEYSRQCAHAGGQPQSWRGPDFCPRTCPLNLQHQECGSPCADTCSNPERSQLCEDHCVDGCFCPPGTVLDDITNTGCLPLDQCPCAHSGHTYAPGASFSTHCSSCTCSGGLWQCQDLPCPGTCSVQGGSHISTYDEKLYDLHGDCSYVLSKRCMDNSLTVLAELRKCGLTDNENCLKAVTLSMSGGDTTIRIQANGGVLMNSIYTQLPVSAANITMFRPSTFFILVQTGLGLQLEVQLVPLMQVVLRLDPAHRGQMCGLCGNFNQNQADDLRALSGVVEGTAAAFANTWKTQAACPNVKNIFEDPCSLSVENENYAQHWCSLLTSAAGAFSPCHSVVNPAPFHANCLFDTCNCEKSEDCLCAALSSYARACAAKGVLLSGWRAGVCAKYMSSCPKSQVYTYVVDRCQPTCRGLSQADVTCAVTFVPVDGCTCPHGTFMDDAGTCVSAEACPCYFRGSVVAPGEVLHDNGMVCSCVSGKLNCLGATEQTSSGCVAPMVYLDCGNASVGTPGAECLRSCHTLDVDCFSTHCVSGCVCPPGLVSDGNGGCVAEEDCPCLHNEAAYRPGDTIRVDCNTCTCKNRRWECSHLPCLGTCVAYGDGHFITFDGEWYSFDGSCEYTLAQDHCGGNGSTNGTFRIVTENVPCGTTGVTCSKAIKLFLENYELTLQEGTYKAVQRGPGGSLPYQVRYMGTHLAIEARNGLVVSWDRKTSVLIRLQQDYKGKVCGLCGNFDDNAANDFTTRSQSVVGDALEFGNSWKFSPSCPDAPAPRDPCSANPYRKSWAQKQCSIINSPAFAACRSQVDPAKYYEACVSDACACDSGGDCECFCTAVAAYAQACRDVGVCVSWRTPDVCPLFCDYYNPQGECEWHYQPCGAPCLRTCRNPSGRCLMDMPGLEGCYPRCPPSKPFFSEDQMKCVAQCGCYGQDGNHYDVGASVPTTENCQSCDCTPSGIQCTHSLAACKCSYEGRSYSYGDVIYNTTDGLGACLVAVCGNNGTITRRAMECPRTFSTTPFTFTSTAAPPSTTGLAPTLSAVCVREVCRWSTWYDSNHPEPGMGGGDFETFANLRQKGHQVCPAPAGIECRARQLPDMPLEQLGQKVECSQQQGLTCLNSEQSPPLCHNYELRVLCCDLVPCSTTPGLGTSQEPTPGSLPTPTPTLQATTALTSQTQSTSPATTETRGASSSVAPGTTCQPRCWWTEWFDADYPTSEEAGGDIESYDKIRSAGGTVCEWPQDIECRAENFPDRSPEELGQHVHCDPRFGLVCRNDEQVGLFKICYNYRIRVLCCSQDHCGGHTTATSSAATATATAATATTATATSTAATVVTGPPLGSTTAMPFLPTGPKSPRTSPNPSHTDTLETSATRSPTSPPGSTKPTTLGRATTPQGTTAGTSTARPTARTPVGTAGTASTNTPPASHGSVSTPRAETPQRTRSSTEAATSQGTTACQPKCEWTEWFDVDFPTSGVTGGDMETYDNIRAAGGNMCREPQKIECRAESYPEVSIDQIGQVVSCSLQAGLVCRNRDQKGHFNMCFNYNVRLLCCDDTRHCPTSAQAPPTTAQGASSRATRTEPLRTSPTTTPPGSPTIGPTSGTSLPSSTLKPSSSSPTATAVTTGACTPRCVWTDWFDVSLPMPGADGGEFETYANIRAAGRPMCERPVALECRAELLPDVPLQQLGQVVLCRLQDGLVCRNRDQHGQFKMCLNYQIRVLCCDFGHCPRTPATTTVTSPRTGPGLASTTALSAPTPSTAHATASSRCQPACRWTDWLDSDRPLPGRYGGDVETYYHIQDAGGQLCAEPDRIECEAVLFPGVPLERLGQVLRCDVHYGLICRNSRQWGGQTCLNYHVRVRCCDDFSHCAGTASTTARATGTGSGRQSSGGTRLWTTTTTQTLLSSPGTTQRVTTITRETRPSYTGTTKRVASLTSETTVTTVTSEIGPSSPRTTQWVATTHIPLTSVRTTGKVSVSSPSGSPRTPTTKPALPSGPHTAPLVTLPAQTTPGSPSTGRSSGAALPSSPLKPSSSSPTPGPLTPGACTQQCVWTDWFDEDYPTPGPSGGDFETFEVLRLAGHVFCEHPKDIECRSERAPAASLAGVGQVVQCNVSFGLVCRNRDQPGPVPYCHNFHVRLLCCDLHCGPSLRTTVAPPPPPETPSRRPPFSASSIPRPVLSSRGPTASPMPPSPATPCRCRAFGQLFLPGECGAPRGLPAPNASVPCPRSSAPSQAPLSVPPADPVTVSSTGDVVYNRTDSAGCHFYAVCNPHCELDRFQGACPTSSPPEPSSSVPPTSAARGCDLVDPPRQVNETWTLKDCTVAKCEGDNHIALLEPKPVAKVTCVNGHMPIKVQSPQDPCEYHYECECSCSGWGSKYRTFDGTSYSFRGNCTHVLVREIHPRFGNLSVLLNSYYCAAPAAPRSCPRALIIHYGSTEIILSTATDAGREESLILFDHVRVTSGFSRNGVSVSVTANSTMHVDIPAIGASITMHGQAFQILLSYSHFSYNTEGQCGTCTNNKTDDCRQPDGTMAPTCQDMAHGWLVPDSSKDGCWAPTGSPPTASSLPPAPTTPSASTCPPAPLCEVMLSQVFAECHSLIPPDPFFRTCVSDSCQAGPVPCQTLEAYAALCRARGACSDWRNATNGLCDLTCPPGKVYKPCGPVQPMSCDSRNHSLENKGLAEGCFCPDGHILFNSYTDVCVSTCPCVGPDGYPKFPGERWVSNCQACECDEGSVAVQCVPVRCEAHRPPPECGQAGFVSVSRPQADNPCCSETLCVCNATTCPQGPPECGPGEELTRTLEEGSCCPTFACRPKLCTYNDTVYGVGATFPATVPCHTCTCLSVDTQGPTVQCKEDTCNATCPQGSEYVRAAGRCCGECVHTACLTPDGRLVQPNETWVDSRVDNCTEYRCQDESGVHMLTPRPVTCRDVSSCRGILRKTGCCYSCEEVDSCQVHVNRTILRHGDCEALVNVTFCEGSCPGVSKYSAEAQAMQRQCTCCQETEAHQQVVTMQCPDGTAVQRTYTHVDACGCAPSCAPSPVAPEDSTPVLPS